MSASNYFDNFNITVELYQCSQKIYCMGELIIINYNDKVVTSLWEYYNDTILIYS